MAIQARTPPRPVYRKKSIQNSIQNLRGVTGVIRDAIVLFLHGYAMLIRTKHVSTRHQQLLLLSFGYVVLINMGMVMALWRYGSVVDLPLRGQVDLWDVYLPLVAIASAPAIGAAVEIARNYLNSCRATILEGTWPHRTIVGFEVVVILLALYFATDYLTGTLLGPVVDLTEDVWSGVVGQTAAERVPVSNYVASIAGFYLWGAIFFYYIRRQRLSDLLPLTKYSGVFFSRDYAVLGLAITLSVTAGRIGRPLFVNFVVAPIYPIVASVSQVIGFWYVIISVSVSYAILYIAAFVIPLYLVGTTSQTVGKFSTECRPLCDTTRQAELTEFAPGSALLVDE
ncbi:hypothetical protein [Halegenticoccus tardaugens]|uniref:hypothetical protein n=1 Tax=Halegenticoccus tardaugens TaxID=2071624 RepID=UPI00100AA41B|nr:hypothetical protein [Halegenticoccus tardaugens]